MKKRALVTRIDETVEGYVEVTLPVIKDYANRCKAELITLSHNPPVWTEDQKPHYRALKIYDMFEEYDRILHLDADMLINKDVVGKCLRCSNNGAMSAGEKGIQILEHS